MASNSSEYGRRTGEDDHSGAAWGRRRTWMPAAPFVAAAAVAWVAAAITQYNLNDAYATQAQATPFTLKTAVLETTSQVLLFAGIVLFTLGILVVVLRQHERWRRNLPHSLDHEPDEDDRMIVAEGLDEPVDVTPSYVRRLHDQGPDQPDQAGR